MKRILSLILSISLLLSLIPKADTANVTATPGLQLQTILVNPSSGTTWTTQSWGGENLVPNSNWTTLTIRDYYFNGQLNFEVRNTGGERGYTIGLHSKRHGVQATINWEQQTATTEWTAVSLPIKQVADANPDSAFSLDDFWYVAVRGSGAGMEFRNVTFTSPDDERQYPFIKVNQTGYEVDAPKTARVSYFSKFGDLSGKAYQIINATTNQVAFTGTIGSGFFDSASSGEMVHVINFDSLNTAGEYFIRIPEAGLNASARSPRDIAEGLNVNNIESVRFSVKQNVYEDLLVDLIRYFYFQRQGIDLEAKYAGDFARRDLHPLDVTVRKWSDRDNPDATTHDVSQGWYDAGDYGKYIAPANSTVSDLLWAYELFPSVFADLRLNIPETDPSNPRFVDAPGILSEIKWELDMIKKFEHPSKDGSFYIAANYTSIGGTETIFMEDTRTRSTNHNSPAADRDLRSHHATAGVAAVLAHAYLIYRDVPAYADFAEECLTTAIRAWNWVTNPANPLNMSIGAANRTYTFTRPELEREMFWAAGALYRAVKASGGDEARYETYLRNSFDAAVSGNASPDDHLLRCFDSGRSVNYNHGGKAFKGFVHYLYDNPAPAPALAERFASSSNGFPRWRQQMFGSHNHWGTNYPTWGYWWGSNQQIAQNSMTFLLGSVIVEGLDKLPANVVGNMQNTAHHLLGINPMSFSYVSHNGENSVQNIYSGIFSEDSRLTPYKCPPGYFTEGSNFYDNRHLSKFDGKCYIDSDGEYTTNENTIYGNAAMVFLMAAVMSSTHKESFTPDPPVSTQPPQTTAPATTGGTPAQRLGDVDDNGRITINDALEILKFLAKLDSVISPGNAAFQAALIASTATPNINDALEILKHLAKLDSRLGAIWR
jgi:hypothetical protein